MLEPVVALHMEENMQEKSLSHVNKNSWEIGGTGLIM